MYAKLRVVAKECACRLNSYVSRLTEGLNKKDWIEQLIVLAPTIEASGAILLGPNTCRAKLLNTDWLRQRAFIFLNHEGTFLVIKTRIGKLWENFENESEISP